MYRYRANGRRTRLEPKNSKVKKEKRDFALGISIRFCTQSWEAPMERTHSNLTTSLTPCQIVRLPRGCLAVTRCLVFRSRQHCQDWKKRILSRFFVLGLCEQQEKTLPFDRVVEQTSQNKKRERERERERKLEREGGTHAI